MQSKRLKSNECYTKCGVLEDLEDSGEVEWLLNSDSGYRYKGRKYRYVSDENTVSTIGIKLSTEDLMEKE